MRQRRLRVTAPPFNNRALPTADKVKHCTQQGQPTHLVDRHRGSGFTRHEVQASEDARVHHDRSLATGVTMLLTIFVGIVAGFLAGKVMKGSGYGVLMDLVLGLVGGLVGGLLVSMLGLNAGGGLLWSVLVATLGAVVLVWLVRLVTGNRHVDTHRTSSTL
jgi:uncharacterized membrane protein YeaQ/YmgE (transglycosylase-associated protein family)